MIPKNTVKIGSVRVEKPKDNGESNTREKFVGYIRCKDNK